MRAAVLRLALVFAACMGLSKACGGQVITSPFASHWSEADYTTSFDFYSPPAGFDMDEDGDPAAQSTLPAFLIALLLGGSGGDPGLPGISTPGGSSGGTNNGGGSNSGGGIGNGGGGIGNGGGGTGNGGGGTGNGGGDIGGSGQTPEPGAVAFGVAAMIAGAAMITSRRRK